MRARRPARTQERVIDHSPSGIRWFKCYEALDEFGSASAYWCHWDETTERWVANTTLARTTIYSTAQGVTASEGDFVPCWLNGAARLRWEVISVPAAATGGIPFRNDSGYTVPAHGIMQENGSVTITGDEYVKIIRPDGTPKSLYLVNLEDAVEDGDTGLGTWLHDAGWLAYEGGIEPAAKESWGPQSGSFLANRGAPGFYIIGNSDGSKVRARQRVVGRVFAITQEEMSQGGSASCRIVSHNGNNFYLPAIDEIEVYDFFMNLEESITANTKIEATLYDSDVWVLAVAYCDETDTAPAGSSSGGTDGGGGGTGSGGSGGTGSGGAVAGGAPGVGLGDVMLFGPENFTEPGFLPQEAL